MERRAATFRDQVDVLRINANGPSDQLSCDVLTIYFEPRKDRPAAKPGGQPALGDLEPRRLEAQGSPVALSGKSQQIEGRGQRLQYDLVSQQIQLEGTEEAWLRQGINEIHSPSFTYLPGPPGKLGQVEAKGPGWLRAEMRTASHAKAASASQQPRPRNIQRRNKSRPCGPSSCALQPEGQTQKISLTGGARLRFPQLGQLDAREIHFWVKELPQPGPTGSRYTPDRMHAEGDVRIDSPQLTGILERMDVEFLPLLTPAQAAAVRLSTAKWVWLYWTNMQLPPEQPAPARWPRVRRRRRRFRCCGCRIRSPAGRCRRARSCPARVRKDRPRSPSRVPPRQRPPRSAQRFHVEGRSLRARVILTEPQAEVAELTVDENVRLQQVQVPGSRSRRSRCW